MNPTIDSTLQTEIASRYAAASDDALFALLLESDQLEAFAVEALIGELERRRAPTHYGVAVRRIAKPLTAAEHDDLVAWVRSKPCSRCGLRQGLTNAVRFVPYDRKAWQTKSLLGQVEWIACKPCIRSQLRRDVWPLLASGVVGLPWSFPMFWFAFLRNLTAFVTTFRDRPSVVLLEHIKRNRSRLILELARECVSTDRGSG